MQPSGTRSIHQLDVILNYMETILLPGEHTTSTISVALSSENHIFARDNTYSSKSAKANAEFSTCGKHAYAKIDL